MLYMVMLIIKNGDCSITAGVSISYLKYFFLSTFQKIASLNCALYYIRKGEICNRYFVEVKTFH